MSGAPRTACLIAYRRTALLGAQDRRTASGIVFVVPFLMVAVLLDDDPQTGVAEFSGLGDSGDVACHTAPCWRLHRATLSYHAVCAPRRQQGPLSYGRALGIARAVIAAHDHEVRSFWPPMLTGRTRGARRRTVRPQRGPPHDIAGKDTTGVGTGAEGMDMHKVGMRSMSVTSGTDTPARSTPAPGFATAAAS